MQWATAHEIEVIDCPSDLAFCATLETWTKISSKPSYYLVGGEEVSSLVVKCSCAIYSDSLSTWNRLFMGNGWAYPKIH